MLSRRLVLFILSVAGAFVYIGNAIPQIKSEAVADVKIGESPEDLVAAGKKVFMSDRAQCLTCHSIGEDPKARCPNQEGLGERAPKSKPGLSGAEYLVEAAYNPNAYVVSGYPKNQMTPVNRPPIALSHDEILAVLSFLNTLGGRTDAALVDQLKKAQDPWRKGLLKPEEAAEETRLPILPGDPARGREIYQKETCIQCHRIGAEGYDICPDLTAIAGSQSADYILESILQPSTVIVKGYRQLTVLWKDESQPVLGTPVAWVPSKEQPRTLRLGVQEFGKTEEREIDLSEASYVGDTTVVVEEDDEIKAIIGEYVSGDAKAGVTLSCLEDGRWLERRIPPERITAVNFPLSPMPSDFDQRLTAREMYDLVAYLMTLKVKR